MKIPNDSGPPYRLNKFVEYQHNAAPLDPMFLTGYAELRGLNPDECALLCFLHSAVYSEITAVYLFETLPVKGMTWRGLDGFWLQEKKNLVFNSSRRYAKSLNWFVPIMKAVLERTNGKFFDKLYRLESYAAIREWVEELPFTGHFASGRFMEPLVWMAKRKLVSLKLKEPEALPWKDSANETSGLMNIMYQDETADRFDLTGKIYPVPEKMLDDALERVKAAIFKRYPRQLRIDSAYRGKLCSWRNLFKGRRYGGYHYDRQLETLLHYEEVYPQETSLWKTVRRLRRDLIPKQLLGEVGGWDGIRKNRNKLWITTGKTGVEEI